MVESAKKAQEGRPAESVPEAKGLAELLNEIDLAENPWKDPGWDPLEISFPPTHPYARVANDVQKLRQTIEDRDKVIASVRSEIEGLIAGVPALQQRAQAALEEGGQNAELQRAHIRGRIAERQDLRVLLKRFDVGND
jgi:hypothetical protein